MSKIIEPSFKTLWTKDISLISDLCTKYSIIRINQKYLLNYDERKDLLNIYDLNSLNILDSIKLKNIGFFNFHKHYEKVFFVCIEKNVIIYLFNSAKRKMEKLSNIYGHFNKIIFADFSPMNPNILVSISLNYDIKIYDIKKAMPISHIYIDRDLSKEIVLQWKQFKDDDDEMGIISQNKIIFFSYINFVKQDIKEISFQETVNNFIYYDEFYLIVQTSKEIKFVQDQKNMRTIEKLDKILTDIFFCRKNKILFLFFREKIIGLYINYTFIKKIFYVDMELFNISFINEQLLKENELCKFYSSNKEIITYSIINKNSNFLNDINNSDNILNTNDENIIKEDEYKNFLNGIKENISDIKLLISKENNIEKDNHLLTKKYFDYPELIEELQTIQKVSLFARKKKVVEGLNKINNKKDVKNMFFDLLKLIIKDNTNEALITIYLKFLKNNDEKLKSYYFNNYENYESELKYYLIFFTSKDIFNDFKIKKKSNKEIFIDFLNDSSKYNNIYQFEKYINSFNDLNANNIFFNMPITSENEELNYFRYLNIIKYYFKKLKLNLTKEYNDIQKEKCEDNIKKNKYEEYIKNQMNIFIHKMTKTKELIEKNILDKQRLEYLIILTSEASNIMTYDFCYNLITSKNLTKNEIEEYKKKNYIKDKNGGNNIINKNDDIESCNNNNLLNDDDKSINSDENKKNKKEKNKEFLCLKNEKLYKNNVYYSKKIYNYNYYKNKYPEKYNLSKLKEFYKKILPKKCFKSIYTALYNDIYYPFEDENFTNDFIDKNFQFIPMKLDDINGLTDKYSMKIFISSFLPKVFGTLDVTKDEQKLLREGLIVGITNHEIGHIFVLVNFFMENARISIETPRKKSLEDDDSEGGYYIEYALYGRLLETINIEQALYLLNEKNYDKSFLEFQEGFNNIKSEDLKLEGIFKDYFKDFNSKESNHNKNNNKNPYIAINKKNIPEKLILYKIKNDVIGKRYNEKNT